jgi:hypothetical protein
MAITQTSAPDELLQAFLAGFGTGAPNRVGQPEFSLPLYTLSIAAVKENPKSPRLQLAGWQFLTRDPQGRFVIGEVPSKPDGERRPTTSLARGPSIEEAWKAYTEVKAHPELQSGNFVLRRLRMSALRIDAFWLKATPPGAGGATGPKITSGGTSLGTEQNAPDTDSIADGDFVFSFTAFQQDLKFKLVSAPQFLRIVGELSAEADKREPHRSVP